MKLLTFARNLKRRKARDRERRFVVEGIRAIEELFDSTLVIRGIISTPELQKTPRGAALWARILGERYKRDYGVAEVSEGDFASAAETESPQGVLAIADIPERSFRGGNRILVLDGVQDPGNVGTILRTAAALGVDETVALPGTVDLWNAKVVRASMGALFRHWAFSASVDDLLTYLAAQEIPLWCADAHGDSVDSLGGSEPRLALAVGNEGAGLSPAVRAGSARTLALPIQDIESLNVAVATGILLYLLRPITVTR